VNQEIDLQDALQASLANAATGAALYRLIAYPVARPPRELAEFLARFHEVAPEGAAAIIEGLVSDGWLLETGDRNGSLRVLPDGPLLARLQGILNVPPDVLEIAVASSRERTGHWQFRNLGEVKSSTSQFSTWVSAISSAEREVIVWVMASMYDTVAEQLQVAASRNSVSVRVLIGSRHDVSKHRTPAEGKRAEQAGHRWGEMARGVSNFEVRKTTTSVDLVGAGSTLIDGRIWRFTVYEDDRERGTDGQMIEVASIAKRSHVNLVALYEVAFEDAWRRSVAIPTGSWFRRLLQRTRNAMRWVTPLLLIGLGVGLIALVTLARPQQLPESLTLVGGVIAQVVAGGLFVLAGNQLRERWRLRAAARRRARRDVP
jgi:hypothetical protein